MKIKSSKHLGSKRKKRDLEYKIREQRRKKDHQERQISYFSKISKQLGLDDEVEVVPFNRVEKKNDDKS